MDIKNNNIKNDTIKNDDIIENTEHQLTKFNIKEVEENNFIIIDDKVYDFSEFEKEHPGGAKVLIYYRGKDASVKFHKIKQHTDKIKENLVNFQVGILVI